MESNPILTEKRQALTALKLKADQLPKAGKAVTAGMILTFLGVPTLLLGFSGLGFLSILTGVVAWNAGSAADLKRKQTLDKMAPDMLQLTLDIRNLEHE